MLIWNLTSVFIALNMYSSSYIATPYTSPHGQYSLENVYRLQLLCTRPHPCLAPWAMTSYSDPVNGPISL